jgi:acyl-CoA synthetase (AMP-forming)/AMP-acid ligase II
MFERFLADRFAPYRQPVELTDAWRRAGLYPEASVGPWLTTRMAQAGPRLAIVDGEARLSHAELLDRAGRLAGALRRAGVEPGEVVSWQVPNWWEAVVIALATWQVGAVNNPILPIYREHELRQIFDDLKPAAVLAAVEFRRTAHAEMLDDVLAGSGHQPRLKVAVRGGRGGWEDFAEVTGGAPATALVATAPEDPCVIAYTSGTTGVAKGVVLDSRALLAETEQMRGTWGIAWDDLIFMPAPLAHLTGAVVGVTVPLGAGAGSVLMDAWDPDAAVPLIEREGCCFSAGTPTLLEEIVSRYEATGTRSSLLDYSVGGQAVAPRLIERAEEVGIGAFRLYGMTEHLTTTIVNRSASLAIRSQTDGVIGPGSEISTVDLDGKVLPPGTAGEIRVRGPERMAGYVNPEHNAAALDPEGWFSTGDIGRIDADGVVRIEGRIKEIINRGGEKFSAREMEDVICRHPAVRQAAVVPAPDERFGEVPAAFVVLAAGPDAPDGDGLTEFVRSQGLAKQKTPVAWIAVESLPTTPFGKVKKQDLIARLAPAEVGGEGR